MLSRIQVAQQEHLEEQQVEHEHELSIGSN